MNSKLISQYVENHKEEAINFLVEAIQIPSVTGDELAISNFFKERIEKIGIPVSMYALDSNRPNLMQAGKGKMDLVSYLTGIMMYFHQLRIIQVYMVLGREK